MRRALLLAVAAAAGCDHRDVDAVRALDRPGVGALCEIRHVDPRQQTLLGPGERSHWLQPWRAYSETFPARRMREAVGLLASAGSDGAQARLDAIAASGMARVYTSLNWGDADYDNPARLKADVRAERGPWYAAIRARRLRPHVMIQGHHGNPCPTRAVSIRLTQPAPAGARSIKIDPAALPQLVMGRSGLSADGRRPGVLFVSAAPDGTVTLSRPLPEPRDAGMHTAHVLRFAPFQRPVRADGTPNPAFEETMKGWEQFLAAVVAELKPVFGDAFDLELWNVLGDSTSDFLDANAYYETPIDHGPGPRYELVSRAMLERSLAFFRNPAHGVTGARVLSGFSNYRFTDAGSNLPPGAILTRHLALHGASFPGSALDHPGASLRADGQPNGAPGPDGRWREAFTPAYAAVFPEQALVPLVYPRVIFPDLSLLASVDAAGNTHGRTARPDGQPAPPVYISSFNLNPASRIADLGSEADLWRFKTKVALRAMAAYVGKGAEELIFYSTSDPKIDMVDERDAAGGPVLRAVKRFLAAFAGPDTLQAPRAIALETVASCAQGKQFEGNGTAAFPPLYDGEVVAFFPFQTHDDRFVVPTYVMTRNLAKIWRPQAPVTDPTRYDMPPATFTLTITGLRGAATRAEMLDPLTGQEVPVSVQGMEGGRLRLEAALGDSPRLLVISDP